MKKLLLSVAVIAAMGLSSCGDAEKKEEKKEENKGGTPAVAAGPTFCECNAQFNNEETGPSEACVEMRDKIKAEMDEAIDAAEKMAIQERIEKEMAACDGAVIDEVVVIEEMVATDDGAEWDEFLDDYEEYMDDYIELMKNMKDDPSDMSILTEYTEFAQKSTEWATKMSNASGDFGPEQLARMQEIQAKMVKAM